MGRLALKLAAVIAPVLTFAVLALSLSPAVAAPGPGCLPTPLPSGPGSNSSYSMTVRYGQDELRVTLWRQQCRDTDDVVLLLRATPISISSLLCSTRWFLDQDFSRFDVTFQPSIAPPEEGTRPSFCETVVAPVTLILSASTLSAGEPGTFEPTDDFFLLYYGASDDGTRYVVYRLEIPYPAPALPLPTSGPSLPTITVVATRCNPCRSGQTVGFDGQVDNPGPAMQAEIKAGARLPDGSILPLFNRVVTLSSGPSALTLVPAQSLPAGLSTLDVIVEAAILEPVLGTTLSRHHAILHLLP